MRVLAMAANARSSNAAVKSLGKPPASAIRVRCGSEICGFAWCNAGGRAGDREVKVKVKVEGTLRQLTPTTTTTPLALNFLSHPTSDPDFTSCTSLPNAQSVKQIPRYSDVDFLLRFSHLITLPTCCSQTKSLEHGVGVHYHGAGRQSTVKLDRSDSAPISRQRKDYGV